MKEHLENSLPEMDLERIAERILELCNACTHEHLQSLVRSQAESLLRAQENHAASTAALN